MLGANKSLVAALGIAFGAVALPLEVARAVLGNILFPSEQEASRAASAMALHAISQAIQAFEQRELNDPKASQILFAQSRTTLQNAAKTMFLILSNADSKSEFGRYLDAEVSLEKLSKDDFYFYRDWARRLALPK
jgi:hypothetical protein